MPAPSGNIHYLPQNHHSWSPAAVIFLDSETRTVGDGAQEAEQLRCWAAQLVRRRHRRRAGEVSRADGTDAMQAAEAIDAWASEDKSTWLYAHNVAFDLVTTNLAVNLARLGWELSSRHAVSGASPWMILHKGRQVVAERRDSRDRRSIRQRIKWQHTLTITDSFSLTPVRLDQLAAYAPIDKPALPRDSDDLQVWLARCWADVEILSWSVLSLMRFWDDNDLGKWAISGAASGWNAYRHKLGAKDVLIDPDQDALALEHQAIYGGRRDVFRCGRLPAGRYSEIDFTAAYPTIAATQLLPAKRMGPLTAQIASSILKGQCRYGMVAEVELDTEVARWPVRELGRVFYPVGRFVTTLAGPEIAEAHRLGCLVEVRSGYFYAMSDHMQPWASWVLALQQAPDDEVPGPVKIAAKAWSRSVCGKWAQRGWQTESIPGPPGDGWSYEDVWIAGSEARASICGLGDQRYLSIADQESESEFPAILAYIEAHCRLRLARVIESAPAGSIIQCDTDGLMASMQTLEDGLAARLPWLAGPGHRKALIPFQLTSWATLAAPLTMREKTSFTRAVVHGPQHVEIEGKPRFAGMPASAWASGENRWAARLWPGLSWQIRHGAEGSYVRPVHDYLVVGPYAAGWVLDTGLVRPVQIELDASGANRILPWHESSFYAAGDQLAEIQAGWVLTLGESAVGSPVGDRHDARTKDDQAEAPRA